MGWTPPIEVAGLDEPADEGPTRVRSSLAPLHESPTMPNRARESSPTDLLNIRRGGAGVGGVLDVSAPDRVDPVERPRVWRAFIDAVGARLEGVFWGDPPADVKTRLAAMASRVAAMDVSVTQLEIDRVRALGVEARGRELRIDHGNSVDALASTLAQHAKERDESAARRTELLRRREEVQRTKGRGAAGLAASDALLWELAACEETFREQVAACEALEARLHGIEAQLMREEQSLAVELDALIRELGVALESIDALETALRADAHDLDALVSARTSNR